MSLKKVFGLILIFSGISLLVGFIAVRFFQSGKPTAGLKVDSTPPSLVFVDSVQVGRTPIDKVYPPGEVTVKLIPDSTSSAVSAYQTKVRLTPQTYSIVKRDFGDSESASAGETVYLQPDSSQTTSLSIITSIPDSASVTLDDKPQGFTPLLIADVIPGDHKISLSAPGFSSRDIYTKTFLGYKSTLNAKLAGSFPQITLPSAISATPTLSVSATPSSILTLSRPFVTITSTPTGFLRVRSGPGRNFAEVGQVKPGDNLPLLKTENAWYLIQADLTATSSGWISSEYAKKFE